MEEDNLKQNILAVISGLLCEDNELRNVAEDRRKALEFKPEYPIQLADILHDVEEPVEERLMCGMMLREYINQFWEFNTSFCTNEVKATTRTLLSHALGDQNVRIMDTAAYLLVLIAEVDYPHTWKEVLSMLTDKLRSNDQRIVIGGVTFMQECFNEFPQLLQENLINEAMFDFFYGITEQENMYNTKLRSKVVELVTSLIIQDFAKDKDIARVGPTANRFTAIMGYILNQQYSVNSDFQIKAAIVAAYTKFLCSVPEMVGQLVISTLPIIWDILIACAAEYRQVIAVRANSNAFLQSRVLPLDCTEESGYPTNFMTLVDNIFTMIHYVSITEEPFASVDVDLYMGEKNLTDIFHSILIFSCASPYTERDIYNSDFDYTDDELLEDDIPISYVSVSVTNSSRAGLRHLLRSVIRSSSSVMKSLACLRMAIVRALEYMQLRRAVPPPAEVVKLKDIEEECDVLASAAAQRASHNAGLGVVVQRPRVPQPIFTPLPGGYDLFSTRIAEGIMYMLCSISSLVGSPDQVLSPMVQPALIQQPRQQPRMLPDDRPEPSGLIGLSGNLDNLMLGFGRRIKPNTTRLTNIEFSVREFLNKFIHIAQVDDVLLNCRLTLTAAHYAWIFSRDEYKCHLQRMLEQLHGNYDICRHAALRALSIHCSYFKCETQPAGFANIEVRLELRDEFKNFVQQFTNCLITLSQFANIEMLNVIMANLTYLIVLHTHAPEQMVDFIMSSLSNHMGCNHFVKNVKMLIDALTTSVQNKNYFQRELFQRLVEVVRTASRNAIVGQNERIIDKAVGLDLFGELLRTIDDPEIRRDLIGLSFRNVYLAIMSGPADIEVARNGQRCVSMFFLRFGDQMIQLGPTVTHESFIIYFKHTMDLVQPADICVGLEHPFLCMLIYLHESFSQFLDGFVKSLLSRLNHSQSLDVRDSLIMLFLALFYYHREQTMRLLDMLPGPDGTTSALIFIIPQLLDVHYNSCYTQNLYVHVITTLMEQTFVANDRRFVDLLVMQNYSQIQGVVHTVHNRHVLQPRQPIPMRQIGYQSATSNGHSTSSAGCASVDSDNALPPMYRTDGTAIGPHQRRETPPSIHPIQQARLSIRGAAEARAAALADRAAIASSSGPGISHGHRQQFAPPPSIDGSGRDCPSTSHAAAPEVESMDLGTSNTYALPSLDLRSLISALSAEELFTTPDALNVSSVPFLRKAFRILLDVLLTNRRVYRDRGEVILTELNVFPDADPMMDIRRYQPLTTLASMEVVPYIQTFFNNLVDFNYIELHNLRQDLNEHHRHEVDRLLREHAAKK